MLTTKELQKTIIVSQWLKNVVFFVVSMCLFDGVSMCCTNFSWCATSVICVVSVAPWQLHPHPPSFTSIQVHRHRPKPPSTSCAHSPMSGLACHKLAIQELSVSQTCGHVYHLCFSGPYPSQHLQTRHSSYHGHPCATSLIQAFPITQQHNSKGRIAMRFAVCCKTFWVGTNTAQSLLPTRLGG